MQPLPKEYDPKAAEARWQQQWLKDGVYAYQGDRPRGQTFVIDTPPPTVSGVLHMGHVFSYTQADFVARYQRMSGKDVFYPMGFDDNGLPTERLVEKVREKKAAQYESREAFVAACREVVKSAEEEFRTLFRSIALSVDWKLEYQTISDEVRKLSQASFVELLGKGEAYRDFRPTYWDWVDQTAIAQAEIENKELPGVMYDVQFTIYNSQLPITIATTRPELLGACVAVMYHPEDVNAPEYKDKYAVTPLFGVKVPMIADEAVDKEFGSGLVMCCTFGDDTDKEWQKKYKLPVRAILNLAGKIEVSILTPEDTVDSSWGISFERVHGTAISHFSDLAIEDCIDFQKTISTFEQMKGLKPKQAHAKMVELLTAAGKILSQKNITHTVKCAERSGTPIEIIPTHQWFVRVVDKKEALKKRINECVWHPEFMKLRAEQWNEGLKEDWCISRQRFFGVPFPVWYSKRAGEEGKIIVADGVQLPVNPLVDTPPGYAREEVTPDSDVMDTWATSSLTPFIGEMQRCRGAEVQNNPQSAFLNFCTSDLRPQAHEIIRTWAFYTIVKAHLHAATIPWKNLMISGWCLAADKSKMSKSKGNVVTPVALIEDKGADAVRYWASTSRLGADTAFSEDLLKIGRKLVMKLWNASHFVAGIGGLGLGIREKAPNPQSPIPNPLDRWILTRLHHAVAKATAEFERFEYCDARVAVEDFFWNDFCDNYLELVKERAYGGDASALHTLHRCLEAVLRLFAPFVPHVAEEIYSHLFAGRGSIHARGTWPKAEDYPVDAGAEKAGIAAVETLNVIRKAKSEAGVSIKFPVERVGVSAQALALITPVIQDLKSAGNVLGAIEAGEPGVTLAREQSNAAG